MKKVLIFALLLLGIFAQNADATEHENSFSEDHKKPIIRKFAINQQIWSWELADGTLVLEGHGEKEDLDKQENFDYRENLLNFLLESLWRVATRPNDNVDPNFAGTDAYSTERTRDLSMILGQINNTDTGQNLIQGKEIEMVRFLHALPPHEQILEAELRIIHNIFWGKQTQNIKMELAYIAVEALGLTKSVGVEEGNYCIWREDGGGVRTSCGYRGELFKHAIGIFDSIVEEAKKHPQLAPVAHNLLDLMEQKGMRIEGKEFIRIGVQP